MKNVSIKSIVISNLVFIILNTVFVLSLSKNIVVGIPTTYESSIKVLLRVDYVIFFLYIIQALITSISGYVGAMLSKRNPITHSLLSQVTIIPTLYSIASTDLIELKARVLVVSMGIAFSLGFSALGGYLYGRKNNK